MVYFSLNCITPTGLVHQRGIGWIQLDPVILQHRWWDYSSVYLQNGFPGSARERANPLHYRLPHRPDIGLYRGTEHGRPPLRSAMEPTIERQLTKDAYFTVAYVANKGTRLISGVAGHQCPGSQVSVLGEPTLRQFCSRTSSLNGLHSHPGWAAQMTGCAPSVPGPAALSALLQLFLLDQRERGQFDLSSFQAKLEKRLVPASGFWGLTRSQADSRTLTMCSASIREQPFAFSPFERERYKSLSTGDVPHSFSGTLFTNCQLEGQAILGHRGGVADKVVGGWQLTSIFTVSSGIPYIFRSSQCKSRRSCGPDAFRPFSRCQSFCAEPDGDFDPNESLSTSAFEPANGFNFYTGKGRGSSKVRGFPYYGPRLR